MMLEKNNQKITNIYLWLNVLTLVIDAFLLSTIYMGISLADILDIKPTLLIIPLIILSLILPAVSFIFMFIDNKKNLGRLSPFRILSNKIYLVVSIIFEIIALLIIFITLTNGYLA